MEFIAYLDAGVFLMVAGVPLVDAGPFWSRRQFSAPPLSIAHAYTNRLCLSVHAHFMNRTRSKFYYSLVLVKIQHVSLVISAVFDYFLYVFFLPPTISTAFFIDKGRTFYLGILYLL